MRLLMPFIACLLMLATGLTAMAHAAERPEDQVSLTELASHHSPGDADEVPADADRNYPHHHGACHGHDIAAPLIAPATAAVACEVSVMRPTAGAPLSSRPADTLLRPPIA